MVFKENTDYTFINGFLPYLDCNLRSSGCPVLRACVKPHSNEKKAVWRAEVVASTAPEVIWAPECTS